MSQNRSVISFRVNEVERDRLEGEAAKMGLKVGALAKLRTLSFDGPPTEGAATASALEAEGEESAPTQPEMEALGEQIRREEAGEAEPPAPDLGKRETYLRFLYERITELHRDRQKRWPGSKARRQAGAEWGKVRAGEPLEKIEPRDEPFKDPMTPTTYRLS